ncbi:motility protein A [Candidatus Dependentiae bacterium]|nr:motility protein A [Candidatus Dependentiae bacterium]
MDFGTLSGILVSVFLCLWSITLIPGVTLGLYWDPPSFALVVGCTIMGYITSTPIPKMKLIFQVGKAAFREKKLDLVGVIPLLVSFAEKARREGLLALEDDIESLDDAFLKRGIQLVVDGTDPELVKTIMQTQMSYIEERHTFGRGIFEGIASLAPAFGMIGTLIGLVAMLKNMDDPSMIGPSMATALITTLYGAIIANIFSNPIANKLSVKSSEEILLKKIMLEGMLAIQAGDNPRIVDEKLKAFLPPALAKQAGGAAGAEGAEGGEAK